MAGLVLRPAPTLWVEWLILAPAWRPITGQHGVGRGLGLKVADRQGCRGCARPVKSASETGSSAWKKLGLGGKAGCASKPSCAISCSGPSGRLGTKSPALLRSRKIWWSATMGSFRVVWTSGQSCGVLVLLCSVLLVFGCSYVPMFLCSGTTLLCGLTSGATVLGWGRYKNQTIGESGTDRAPRERG